MKNREYKISNAKVCEIDTRKYIFSVEIYVIEIQTTEKVTDNVWLPLPVTDMLMSATMKKNTQQNNILNYPIIIL